MEENEWKGKSEDELAELKAIGGDGWVEDLKTLKPKDINEKFAKLVNVTSPETSAQNGHTSETSVESDTQIPKLKLGEMVVWVGPEGHREPIIVEDDEYDPRKEVVGYQAGKQRK